MSVSKTAPSLGPQPALGEKALGFLIDLMERRLLPDPLIRMGIRRLCGQRLAELEALSPEAAQEQAQTYFRALTQSPIAVHAKDANEQHYELPPEFFALVLGKNRKYSCSEWNASTRTLDEAEAQALETTINRAEIRDGHSILELGCGWGSLTLALARRFPKSQITAISNSGPQRESILERAAAEGLKNVRVLTSDITTTESFDQKFDRVVSVEMFEHLRNYQLLFKRISSWMKDDAKMFVHIFSHRQYSYFFDTEGSDNWMGRYFFTGGQMPSQNLFRSFQDDLKVEKQWAWSGTHYHKTSEAWLENLDRNEKAALTILEKAYGKEQAPLWLQRWRVFFLACSELFAYDEGREWFVSHYLFEKRAGK